MQIGQVISDKYKLLRLLGDGGMGSVFEAEHMRLGTHVAIKVLHAELARRTGIAERFVQEARVSAQIRSPHVVQVTDVESTAEGVAYLVMELLQGETLSGVVRRQQKLPVGTAAEYTTQILQALEAAHALGVIHRDLKPDNVFVTFQGGKPVLKLIDFGIAKLKTAQTGQTKNLTVAGMLMGTPEYMAPEQAYSADKVDVRADLYAVGVMLYEMLSGQPPVDAPDPRVLIGKVERGEITPLVQAAPGIDPALAGFVHRAMAPRPELRFATATEMRVALDDLMSGKRQGTAKIAVGSQQPPANVANPANPANVAIGATSAANPLADTANPLNPALLPSQVGATGTMMGAPIESALSVLPSPPQPSVEHAPRGATQGVPAVDAAIAMQMQMQQPPPVVHHAPAQQHQPQQHYAAPPAERRKSGNGLVIALGIVALLLGAGAVVTYVLSTQKSTTPPVATLDLPTNPPPPTETTPPGNTTVTPVTPVNPLTPPVNPPAPAPGPAPVAPKKDGGAEPPKDSGAPPSGPVAVQDAGGGQTTIVTPFGTFQWPGPRPLLWPPDQPWPPPTIQPLPGPPP
ncbi:MAG: serine/threonine protein kinase [Labilithrix sp.]|nr:serine/threonine protein kinase [Labilithrix sp.]MCW5816920.1 serine/threonine protein kinase [Labilithrix sp.]